MHCKKFYRHCVHRCPRKRTTWVINCLDIVFSLCWEKIDKRPVHNWKQIWKEPNSAQKPIHIFRFKSRISRKLCYSEFTSVSVNLIWSGTTICPMVSFSFPALIWLRSEPDYSSHFYAVVNLSSLVTSCVNRLQASTFRMCVRVQTFSKCACHTKKMSWKTCSSETGFSITAKSLFELVMRWNQARVQARFSYRPTLSEILGGSK